MVKKVLLGIGGVLVVAILAVCGLAATKPATFRVERRTVIATPPEAVFPHLEDFHQWAAWSPWEKLDPGMQKTFGGAARGKGATYAWRGNDDVGEGNMTIIESRPNEQLSIRLEFLKPFAATNTTMYTLKPQSNGTEITWAMEGPNSFIGKVMSVFISMDAMIGKDFEEGLANLKRLSEKK
ncbi:MAG: SRPBCC family protein [Polyangiaceae bacterium]|nr:SRPBCC family protein [Polyangiaceae bacterium]